MKLSIINCWLKILKHLIKIISTQYWLGRKIAANYGIVKVRFFFFSLSIKDEVVSGSKDTTNFEDAAAKPLS